MIEQEVEVINESGIHARPSSMIARTAQKFTSSIKLIQSGAVADAKSIMSVMVLAATCGSKVTIRAEGDDETEALNAIAELFNTKFNDLKDVE